MVCEQVNLFYIVIVADGNSSLIFFYLYFLRTYMQCKQPNDNLLFLKYLYTHIIVDKDSGSFLNLYKILIVQIKFNFCFLINCSLPTGISSIIAGFKGY